MKRDGLTKKQAYKRIKTQWPLEKKEELWYGVYLSDVKIGWFQYKTGVYPSSKSKNNSTYEEGCLSVPGQFAEIERPESCHLKFLDYNGQPQEIKAEGMLATCIQHEIDHLEGILFIDYLSKLKKSMIVKKLSKQKKQLERIVV